MISVWQDLISASEAGEHLRRRALIVVAALGLATGLALYVLGFATAAAWVWTAGTLPVLAALATAIARELARGRTGVDAVALVSMSAALLLGELLAAAVVALMYAGGTALEDFAISRAERDLKALLARAPAVAHRRAPDGIADVPVGDVAPGDRIVVRAGEVIPVDGTLSSDAGLIDEQAVTGEPLPVARTRGDSLRSGTVNAGETLELVCLARASESTYARIVHLVTEARAMRSPFLRLADRYAIVLLPAALALAALAWIVSGEPDRGLAVLLAATPCPLILAVPVAFIGGAARAARLGILIKGGTPLEALARVRVAMFDKTGTLTVGGARLVAVEAAPGAAADDVLRLAASLEQVSHHVLARTVVAEAGRRGLALAFPTEVKEAMGSGLEGRIDGALVRAGALAYVYGARRPDDWARRVQRRAAWRSALSVFVARDGMPVGALLLGDELRREAPRAVQALRAAGITRLIMVTGDRAEAAETIAAALDLDLVLADREPSDKVDAVVTERKVAPVVMIGDGINDAPALAAADVGIAMGARGASASSEAADVVILTDRLDRVCDAVTVAQRTFAIARQSVLVGLGLSGAAMIAAALGYLSPVGSALFQEGIDVAVILNALRALGAGRFHLRAPLGSDRALSLRLGHESMAPHLDRLREISDALDHADPAEARRLIVEADAIVRDRVAAHERDDEASVYPSLAPFLADRHGLTAMSRAHREIIHLARLLGRLREGFEDADLDADTVRDAQRVIESVEALVRLHNAQEEDIFDHASRA